MQRRRFLTTAGAGFASLVAGCTSGQAPSPTALADQLTITVSTSTYDTDLIPHLNEAFVERFGIEIQTVPQGTGAALATGRNGDADVVIVHAREQENAFLTEGYGINRRDLMANDFVVVGPPVDPAAIEELDTVTSVFEALSWADLPFISRGDQSGTHHRERDIWDAAGIEPAGDWYRQVGSGMGEVLTHADFAEDAYTFTDRGTFRSMADRLDLEILYEARLGTDPLLTNPYGIIAVNPGRHEHVAYDLAMTYIGFVTSVAGQELIASFTVDGEQLFTPTAIADHPPVEQYSAEEDD